MKEFIEKYSQRGMQNVWQILQLIFERKVFVREGQERRHLRMPRDPLSHTSEPVRRPSRISANQQLRCTYQTTDIQYRCKAEAGYADWLHVADLCTKIGRKDAARAHIERSPSLRPCQAHFEKGSHFHTYSLALLANPVHVWSYADIAVL